jgi:hypothetical protein
LTSGFLEGSSIADAPDWFCADADKMTIAKFVRKEYERVTSDHLLAMCRAGDGKVLVQNVHLMLANSGYQLLSDEAVESIGREDYVRMVACLGPPTTNKYFKKRSGLTRRRSLIMSDNRNNEKQN